MAERSTRDKVMKAALLVAFLPVVIAVAVIAFPLIALSRWLYGLWLRGRWARRWGADGKRALLVYSRSPNWQDYIEQRWLPQLEARIVTLNWSDRSAWPRWRPPLEVSVFRHWGGAREFNPLAVLFPERGKVQVLRYWRAFRHFKHGKREYLEELESRLFDFLGVHSEPRDEFHTRTER